VSPGTHGLSAGEDSSTMEPVHPIARRAMRERIAAWACLLLLLLGGLLPGAASAQGARARVAVFQILPGGLELSEEKLAALSYLAGTRFAEAARVDIIAWDEVYTYLRSQDQIMCLDRTCQQDVERKLGADFGLAVQILPMGKSCHLTATLYPRGRAASLRSALVKGGCSEDALVAGLEQLMDRVAAQGALRPRRDAIGTAPAERQTGPAGDGGDAPRFLLMGSMLYSPAPLLVYDAGGLEHAKSPDQYGPWVAAELRVGEYGSLGLQLSALFGTDRVVVIPALRLGVVLELFEHFSIYGRLMAGMSYYYLDSEPACDRPPCRDHVAADYLGFTLGLGGGARYMFLEHLGAQLELSGGSDTLWLVDTRGAGEPRDSFSFLKLEFAVGVIAAW